MDGIAINSFNKGLNQDFAKTIQQKDSYFNALNFRIMTESGQSTGILSNVKGNTLAITFPDTGNYIKLSGGTVLGRGIITMTFDITVTEQDGTITSETITWTTDGSAAYWVELATIINTNSVLNNLGVVAYAEGTHVFLYSTIYADLTLTNYSTLRINYSTVISAQTNLIPIGSTNIRDEIIILTTSEDNLLPSESDADGTPNPGVGTSLNVGQIWKLTYDASKIDQDPLPANVFTLELLYNNKLNFSKKYPVAPTAITGNYENDTTKKIYWCDFYNKMRYFNTADPDGFFLDLSLIDSVPNNDQSKVIMQSIGTTGSLPYGMYQYTYRLLKTQGTNTAFAPLSNLLHIVSSSETAADGSPNNIYISNSYDVSTNTGKSVTLSINGLDTDYDRIQIAYVRRTTLTPVPDEIAVFYETDVDKTTGSISVTHTGTEILNIAITNSELINPIRPIDIYKSNAIKDSLLLISNVKTSKLDLDWDARAFRWSKNSTGNVNYPIGGTAMNADYLIGEDPGLLPDNNPNQAPTSWNNYLYQYNSTILGGTGANIAYQFVHNTGYETNMDSQTNPQPGPQYRNTTWDNGSVNTGITGQTYPYGNFFKDPTSPYVEAVFRGYQRDEIYRFGIVFYDKKGFPGFVKWIADIRIPAIYMPDTTAADHEERTSQFPLSKSFGQNYYALPIAIKFTVNTSSINDQISGFSIVRVKREQNDKTILAQGIIQPAFDPTLTPGSVVTLKNGAVLNPNVKMDTQYATLYSPETFFETFGHIGYKSGDTTEIVDILDSINGGAQPAYGGNPYPAIGAIGTSAVLKLYQNQAPAILNGTYRQVNGSGGGIGKSFIINNTFDVSQTAITSGLISDGATKIANTSYGNAYNSQGGQALLLKLDSSTFKYVGYNGLTSSYMYTDNLYNNYRKYLVNYKRTVANQYGGDTLTVKSLNNYISCNHYQPVNSSQTLYSSDVFGGDVWISVFDHNDERKPLFSLYSEYGFQSRLEAGGSLSNCYLVPKLFVCESAINVNCRSKDGIAATGGSYPTVNTTYYYNGSQNNGLGLDINECNQYNPMFSMENDVVTYLPKPIPYIEQTSFDNRTYGSNTKINGELADSWNIFPAGDYKDVDGAYGPINAIVVFQNQLHFIQDRAIGIIPVYPRAVLNNAGILDAQLQIGLGNKMDKHQYISTNSGSKHQWSVLATPNSIYYYDVLAKKQYRYRGNNEPLSDIKGMHTYFDRNLTGEFLNHDNPILRKGICTVYDYKNNEIISTFHDYINIEDTNSFTIAYNELADCFTSFYSFTPTIYLSNRQIYLSPSNSVSNAIYVHSKGSYSKFYNTVYPSTLTTIVNENPIQTKVFDNQVFETQAINTSGSNPVNINDSIFNSIRMYNDYQNTDFQTLVYDTNVKRKERSFNIAIPRNRVLYTGTNSPDIFTDLNSGNKLWGERMRDKYLTCDYSYPNTSGYNFLIHNIATKYRVSAR